MAAEAKALVAIQMDCFVVPQSGTPRNDILKTLPNRSRALRLFGTLVSCLLLSRILAAESVPRYPTINAAIARGDLADVRTHAGLDPDSVTRADQRGLPLHQAILRNKTEIALFLLDSGASVDAPDGSARTPLHLAVERGNVALVTALLERKARPNERDGIGWTPLHHAAAGNKLAVARALLAGGTDFRILSERGGTPLHEAAASGGAELVRLLLDAGVDPNIVSQTGVTALDVAREYKNEAAIAVLTTRVSEGG